MKKITYSFLLLFFIAATGLAQNSLIDKATNLYLAKNYGPAGDYFLKAAEADEFSASKQEDYYDAACCYALSAKADSAMLLLKLAVKYGYDNLDHMKEDSDLTSLHQREDWSKLLSTIHPRLRSSQDPLKAQLITTDVKNFWKAYDKAQKDTAHRYDIYRKYYIDPGTPGLQEYFTLKVGSLKSFVRIHDKLTRFYAAIRENTNAVDEQKPLMTASFVKFKELYPIANFPDVYFIIGAFSSAGTSTGNGLLIGLDQVVRTPDTPTDELTLWQQNNLNNLKTLHNTVAHELIHFNQKMADDTTLLCAVLIEGMADFIGELISGKTPNERLHIWAKGKEKKIWADFEKEMYLNRARNWIANSNQETADHPSDLGYWVGYQICKAYYDQSADKKQAIADMLHIKDYRSFYQQSRAGGVFK